MLLRAIILSILLCVCSTCIWSLGFYPMVHASQRVVNDKNIYYKSQFKTRTGLGCQIIKKPLMNFIKFSIALEYINRYTLYENIYTHEELALSLPIFLHFSKEKTEILLGLYPSRSLENIKEKNSIHGNSSDHKHQTLGYKNYDLGLSIGIAYSLSQHLFSQLRYSSGVLNLNTFSDKDTYKISTDDYSFILRFKI